MNAETCLKNLYKKTLYHFIWLRLLLRSLYLLATSFRLKGHSICTCRPKFIVKRSHKFVYPGPSKKSFLTPAIAAMHGPHSVFDIGHYTVIHCGGGGVSLVGQ